MKKVGRLNRNKDLSAELAKKTWELRSKGYNQNRIAEMLNISQCRVSTFLLESRKQYKELHLQEVEHTIIEQVAFHEHVAEEAMIAWEKSKTSLVDKKTPNKVIKKGSNKKDNGGSGSSETISEFKEQYGDPFYLQTAMKAKKEVRYMIGAEEPIKLKDDKSPKTTESIERTIAAICDLFESKREGNTSGTDIVPEQS